MSLQRGLGLVSDASSPFFSCSGDSAFGTFKREAGCGLRDSAAGSAALDMRTGAVAIAGGEYRDAPVLSPSPKGPAMCGGDVLVMTRVSDLKWDDVIFDRHGRRRITEIFPDYSRSYIEFSEGPSAWYLNVEELAVERMT